MIKLSQSISSLLKQKNFSPLIFGKLENNWENIVGERINGATKIVKIEKKTLFIKCKIQHGKTNCNIRKKKF